MHDVAVIGAGISGLALAGALKDLGFSPVVLERGRMVGGRCSTHVVEGRPVDHGVPFLHGRDPKFVAALEAVTKATAILGWPRVREGTGTPCQPEAFRGSDFLIAFEEGVSKFPERLAQGLDVRVLHEVRTIRSVESETRPGHRMFELTMTSGETLHASATALAIPVPHAIGLLEGLAPRHPAVAALRPVLEQVRTVPVATVIATYGPDARRPVWDASYPAHSDLVHAIVNDSSKRPGGPLTLVIHGRTHFSRKALERPSAEWSRELVRAAALAEVDGKWIDQPVATQTHLWRHAMVHPITELAAPLAIKLEHGEVLGLCGDGFGPEGGMEAAYRSALRLATRIADLIGTPAHA